MARKKKYYAVISRVYIETGSLYIGFLCQHKEVKTLVAEGVTGYKIIPPSKSRGIMKKMQTETIQPYKIQIETSRLKKEFLIDSVFATKAIFGNKNKQRMIVEPPMMKLAPIEA